MRIFKRTVSLLLAVAMLWSMLPVSALAAEGEVFSHTVQEDGTIAITGYQAPEGNTDPLDVQIPAQMDGADVTHLEQESFAHVENMRTVVIPATVASIGNSAFYHCENLKAIAFLGAEPSLGITVAEGCTALEKVFALSSSDMGTFCALLLNDLGQTQTQQIEVLEFEDTQSLMLALESYIQELDTQTAQTAEPTPPAVTEETSGNSCGENAVWVFDEETNTLTISGTGAMEESLAGMPWTGAEYQYQDRIENVIIEEGITAVSGLAFSGHTALQNVILPDTLESIGASAFDGCSSLKTLVIPAAVSEIGGYAFAGTGLKLAYFLGDKPTFGENIFSGLQEFMAGYNGANATWENIWENTCGAQMDWFGDVPVAAEGIYENVRWILTEEGGFNIFGEGQIQEQPDAASYPWHPYRDQIAYFYLTYVENVPQYAFQDCVNMTYISLDGAIKSVGTRAFAGCTAVEDIYMEADMPSIAEDAFVGITAKVYFDGSNETFTEENKGNYGGTLFWQTQVSGQYGDTEWSIFGSDIYISGGIPENQDDPANYPWAGYLDSVTTAYFYGTGVPANMFAGHLGLQSVVLDTDITAVGANAFADCENLKEITLYCDTFPIDETAFTGVTADVYFSNTSWSKALRGNYGGTLTWIFGNSDARAKGTLNDGAVHWCVDYGNSLYISGTGAMPDFASPEEAPWYAYKDQISGIYLCDITSIGSCAFAGLTALEFIEIIETVEHIGSKAFADCTGLNCVQFNAGPLESIAEDAFAGVQCVAAVHHSQNDAWEPMKQNYGGILEWATYSNSLVDGMLADGSYWNIGDDGWLNISNGEMNGTIADDEHPWQEYADSITNISLYGILSIGARAFEGLTEVQELNFHDPIAQIGEEAFAGCTGVTRIHFWVDAPEIADTAFAEITAQAFYDISYNNWSEDRLQSYGGILSWNAIGGSGSAEILGSGTFGESGEWSVNSDGQLTITGSGEMPDFDSVEGYPWYNLQEQIFNVFIDGFITVGSHIFESYPNLNSVEIQGNVTSVGTQAFAGCQALYRVNFYGDAPDFAQDAFAGTVCTVLTPIGNTTWNLVIGEGFGGEIVWEQFSFPVADGEYNGVRWHVYNDYCLRIFGSGTLPELPEGETLPWAEYQNLIYRVEFETDSEEGTLEIGAGLFADMPALAQLNFAKNVTLIGSNAFSGCSALTDINFTGTAPQIGENAFGGVTAQVYYPGNDAWWPEAIRQDYGGSLTWTAVAYEVESGNWNGIYWDLNSSGNLFLSCNGNPMPSLESAQEYPWYPYREQVTFMDIYGSETIGSYAFQNFTNLTGVSLSMEVNTIGTGAFAGCTSLESLWLGTSISNIESNAFAGCTGLREIRFEGDAPQIGENAFENVNAQVQHNGDWPQEVLQQYGGSLEWIARQVTLDSGNWQNIDWSVYSDGELTINGPGGDMPAVNGPEDYPWHPYRDKIQKISMWNLSSVGDYAFQNMDKLERMRLDSEVARIGKMAFAGCAALENVFFTDSGIEIANDAFTGVTANVFYRSDFSGWGASVRKNYGGELTWVITSGGLYNDNIIVGKFDQSGGWMWDVNSVLTVFGTGEMPSFPNPEDCPWNDYMAEIQTVDVVGYTVLPANVFDGYPALRYVNLRSGVTQVGAQALANCPAMEHVYFYGDAPEFAEDAFLNTTCTANYPYGNDTWEGFDGIQLGGNIGWSTFNYIVDSGRYQDITWYLESNGLLDLSGSGDLVLPGDGSELPWASYVDLIRILSINEHSGSGEITLGAGLFQGYSRIQELRIGDVSAIGSLAFADCESLQYIYFTGAAPEIGENAFLNVNAQVTIPWDPEGWPEAVRQQYGGTLSWYEQVVEIDYGSWEGIYWRLNSKGELYLNGPGGEMVNGSGPEDYPWHTYRDQVTKIEWYSLNSLGDYAFQDMVNLNQITISYDIGRIGSSAFAGCTGLKNIFVQGQAPEIAEDAFTDVTANAFYCSTSLGWYADVLQNYGGDLRWIATASGMYSDDITVEAFGQDGGWMWDNNGNLTIFGTGEMPSYASAQEYPWYSYMEQIHYVDIVGYTTVGANAFAGYPDLWYVYLRDSATRIESCAFANCPAMEQIYVYGNAPEFAEDSLADTSTWINYPGGDETWSDLIDTNVGGGSIQWSAFSYYVARGMYQGITWEMESNGDLRLSGSGTLELPGDGSSLPWEQYREQIHYLYINEYNDTDSISLGDGLFRGYSRVQELRIGDVTAIGSLAFADCESLQRINFSGAAPEIGENAFQGVTADIYYPDNAAWWPEEILQDYGGSLTWYPESYTLEEGWLDNLYWCVSSDGRMYISSDMSEMPSLDSPESYPWYPYRDQITYLDLYSPTTVGDYAFQNYPVLETVSIQSQVTAIGSQAFAGCPNLTVISFQNDVPVIAEDALEGNSLTIRYCDIYPAWAEEQGKTYGAQQLQWESYSTYIGDGWIGDINWYVMSDGVLSLYGDASVMDDPGSPENYPWHEHAQWIRTVEIHYIENIPSHAFADLPNLQTVNLDEYVRTIADRAFAGCTSLTEFTMGVSVQNLGSWIFDGAENLEKVIFAGQAPAFAEDTFAGVAITAEYDGGYVGWTQDVLQSYGGTVEWVNINQGVEGTCGDLTWLLKDGILTISGSGEMGENPEWTAYTDTVSAVVIESGVTSISDLAFAGMSNMTQITIPNTVTAIGYAAFNSNGLTSVTIPGSVTQMGTNLFVYCNDLQHVTFEEGITSISNYCLEGCKNLQTVSLPTSLRTLEYGAFKGTGLTVVNIPEGVETINYAAFADCENLEDVYIPSTATDISTQAFDGCTVLKRFHVAQENSEYSSDDSGVLYNGDQTTIWIVPCGYTGAYTMPASVEDIYGLQESVAPNMTAIYVEPGNASYKSDENGILFSIDGTHLVRCPAGTSLETYQVPETVTYIGAEAFSGCAGLENVRISGSVTVVDSYAFYNSGLQTVEFGFGVTELGSYAFADCTALSSAVIPNSVTVFGNGGDAFEGCHNLTIYAHADSPAYSISQAFGFGFVELEHEYEDHFCKYCAEPDPYSGTCGEGLIWSFDSQTGTLNIWGNGWMDSYSSGSMTPWYSFCQDITQVVLQEGVFGVGSYAFQGMENLKEVSLCESLVEIGTFAFANTGLEAIAIPAALSGIGENAFYGSPIASFTVAKENAYYCTDESGVLYTTDFVELLAAPVTLTGAYTLSNQVVRIRSNAFRGVTGLEELTVGQNVAEICSGAFAGCTGLTKITFQGHAPVFGATDVFDGVTATAFYPEAVESWSEDVRNSCGGNLTWESYEVILGSGDCGSSATWQLTSRGVLTISGSGAITDTPWQTYGHMVTTVDISDDITTIPSYCFYGFSQLTQLRLPEDLTYIGSNAFDGCEAVTRVEFASVTAPSIMDNIFASMTSLESVYMPGEDFFSYDIIRGYLADNVTIETEWNLVPVTGLAAEKTYSKRIMLAWSAHPSPNVTGYIVFRDGMAIATVEGAEYVDTGLDVNTAYTYTVAAVLEDGQESIQAETILVSTVEPQVNEIKVKLDDGKISNALGYNEIRVSVPDLGNLKPQGDLKTTLTLYYGEGESRTKIGDTAINAALSTADTAVYTLMWDVAELADGDYTVTAVLTDVDGTTAELSRILTVDNTPPAKLEMVAVGDLTGIVLNWTIAIEVDTNIYRIYRRTGESGEFALLQEISGRNIQSYTDQDVAEDETYFYYVVGVDTMGREGEPSEISGASLMQDDQSPRVLSISPENGTYVNRTVTFTAKAEDNLAVTEMVLQYSLDEGETWETFATGTGSTITGSLDTTAIPDGKLMIRVTASDAQGNVSDNFDSTYMVDNTGPEQVTGLSYVSTSVTLTLSWNDVSDEDIGGFQVEQKLEDGTYRVVSSQVSALGINIRDLTPGTAYTYRVTAFDTLGNLGEPSEDITATTHLDVTAPVVVQLLPASGRYSDTMLVSATVRDEDAVGFITLQYSTDGIIWTDIDTKEFQDASTVQSFSARLDLTDIPEGKLYISAVAADLAGNVTAQRTYVEHRVDKTAPAAPNSLAATGGSGFVEVSWVQKDSDIQCFALYRAETAEGPFQLIRTNITSLNYFDRNVEDGKTYFYQVTAQDAAGNWSVASEVVSATALTDTQAPEILSINPPEGTLVGAAGMTVSVATMDNSQLDRVVLEYSADGESYTVLTQSANIGTYSTIVSASIPVAEFAHGDTIYFRATAWDTVGLNSETVQTSVVLDLEAPTVGDVHAQYDQEQVTLTWSGSKEADLSGYRIYRKLDTGSYSVITQVSAVADQSAYIYTDTELGTSGGSYTYRVEAVDMVNNTATADSQAVTVPERSTPKAAILCDTTQVVNAEYEIDGSASTDNSAIVSYYFDFGDGTTSDEAKPTHVYSAIGSYTITLTVTDDEGNTSTATQKVQVKSNELLGTAQILIVDEKGAPVPNAPVYFDLGEEYQVIRLTDNAGRVSFPATVGKHAVGCVIPNNQWLPVKRDVIVSAGDTTVVTMTLVNRPLVEGVFDIKRMTLEEIIAAGIDVTAAENQNYVEVHIKLKYDNQDIEASLPAGPGFTPLPNPIPIGGGGSGGSDDDDNNGGGGGSDDDDDDRILIGGVLRPYEFSEEVTVILLDIPVGVSTLKEFFDVRLHVINNATSEFYLIDNTVTLNVPDGLTLMETDGTDPQTVHIAQIRGQTTETLEWILRGDEVGSYYLDADFSGILAEFNEKIQAKFQAKDAIEVYGMTNLKLVVDVAKELDKGTLYYNVSLVNEGKIDVYRPSISTGDVLIEMELFDETGARKAEEYNFSAVDIAKEGLSTSLSKLPDVLRPGDRLTMHYMNVDDTTYTECTMALTAKLLEYEKSLGLEAEIIEREVSFFTDSLSVDINPLDKADNTFIEGNAKTAYEYVMEDAYFVYWAMVHNVGGLEIKGASEETLFEIIGLNFTDALGKDDVAQARAMVLASVDLAADENGFSAYGNILNWLHIILTNLKNDYANLGVSLEEGEAFVAALEEIENNRKWELYHAVKGYTYQETDSLFLEAWCEELNIPVDEEMKQKLHKIYSSEAFGKVWSALGMENDTVNDILGLVDDIYADISIYVAAQSNIETINFYLDELIANLGSGSDAAFVRTAAKDVKSVINTDSIMATVVQNTAKAGFWKLLETGTDEVVDEAKKVPIVGYVIAALDITAEVMDKLFNMNEQYDVANNIRFLEAMSDSIVGAVTDARSDYAGNKTEDNAREYMMLLSYLLDLRVMGESQAAQYGVSFEKGILPIGSHMLFDAACDYVNAPGDVETWYQWRDYVEDILSRCRVDLLKNPLSTDVNEYTAPAVTFNYGQGRTVQSFGVEYEYSLDGGATWTTCTGSPIYVEQVKTTTQLWVRRTDTQNSLEKMTTCVTIIGAPSLARSGIYVQETVGGYRVDNLDNSRLYEVTFSNTPVAYAYGDALQTTIPQGSYYFDFATSEEYPYVYIRSLGDLTQYASYVYSPVIGMLPDPEATVTGNKVTVNDAFVDAAIDAATGNVVIEVGGQGEETGTEITSLGMSADALTGIYRLMDETALTVSFDNTIVTLDKLAVAAVLEQVETWEEEITLQVAQIPEDQLNEAQRAALEDENVSLVLTAEMTVNDTYVTDFGGGSAEVRIPFTVTPPAELQDYTIWYIANDGATEQLEYTYDSDCLVVELEHFSEYVLLHNCIHDWADATCTLPETCRKCGEIQGEALQHNWVEADCETAKTCSRCSETEGDPLGHDWVDATCEAPKTCSRCSETEGDPLGHSYGDPSFSWSQDYSSCKAVFTCTRDCGDTQEEACVVSSSTQNGADCQTNGTITYTAVYESFTDTKTVPGPVGDHVPAAAVEENRVEPTCTSKGSYDSVIYCSLCDQELDREEKELPLAEHTPGTPVRENVQEATCKDPGSCEEVVYCTVCSGELSRTPKTIEKLSTHTEQLVPGKDATCTEPGLTDSKICSVCGITLLEQEPIEATGHQWEDATCDTAKTCSVCHVTEGDPLGHDWVNATCEAPKTCSRCHKTEGDPLGHSYGDPSFSWAADYSSCKAVFACERDCGNTLEKDCTVRTDIRKGADCVTPGTVTYTAKYETFTETKTVPGPVGDHAPAAAVEENRVESTCTKKGSYDSVIYCSLCGQELSRETKELPLAEHTPGTPVRENVKAATCKDPGSYEEVVYCTVCSGELSRTSKTIDKLTTHTEKLVSGKAPTCTETGLTDGKVCSVCGITLVAQKSIAALGHKWTAATCENSKTCSVCNKTEGTALGHKWQDATCTTPKTCTVCHKTEGTPLGHAWDTGVVTKEPTTTEKGVKTFTCTRCKTTRTEEIPVIAPQATVTRVFGGDRYQTAFKAADTLKKELGVSKFDSIIVASGTGFADALAGSYLAAVKNAPILLVRPANVAKVQEYIKANLNAGGTVYLLGGVNAVPKTMETGLNGFTVKRLGGADRYATNLLILKEAGVGSKDIIVCTGNNFADSLSASATGLPILLVKNGLTNAQKSFLAGTSGRKIIVGGKAAVNETVEKQLTSYGSVKRLAGNSRYDTSILVAQEFFSNPTKAVLAYSENFPDGLAGGPLAYAIKAPLILTATGKERVAVKYTTGLGIKSGYVLGGTGLISDAVVRKVFSMTGDDTILEK